MTVASVMVIMSALGFLFATFQTDAEAAQYQKQNTQEIARFRIQNLDAKITDYKYKIRFANPPEEEVIWMKEQIKELEKLKVCVRKGEC
jgi:hypothetical protein